MTDDAIGLFEAHAGEYEALRRRLVPSFDAFYERAVEGVGLARPPLRRVLDLGAGTGLLARAIADAYPSSELVLLDGSAAMLEQARGALAERAGYVQADFGAVLPDGPWNAVVSALAIHHLEHAGKRELFARVHDALSPGGVFVNAEQVSGASPFFERIYADWHERRARELGASVEEWAGARERMAADRTASVEQQLEWLRGAGFAERDCLFKDHHFAVLVARRRD